MLHEEISVEDEMLHFGESISHTINELGDSPFLNFRLDWEGSSMSVDVLRPDGSFYGSFLEDDGDLEGLIRNPSPGLWTFIITAVDVPPEGEPYSFSVMPVPVPEPSTAVLLCLSIVLIGLGRSVRLTR